MGVGSIPQEPVRAEGARDEFQRSEHRRTAATRRVGRGGLTARERAVVRMARARWAEDLVANLYQRDGHKIIARNWHCREGELDIVCELHDGVEKILVIVEADRHTGYGLNSCVVQQVDNYLVDLKVPENETYCK
ncbi:MAG: hypothetical protein EB142_07270 [Actinobacteria bacterium]|nr:hypothetical protein [Actinomycetota bacterium]